MTSEQRRFLIENGNEEEIVVVAALDSDTYQDVAYLSTREGWTFEELKVEANLIAAAPALLKAAQHMLGSGVRFYEYNGEQKVELSNERWAFAALMAAVSDALGKHDEANKLRDLYPEPTDPPVGRIIDHDFQPAIVSGEDMCTHSWRVESERTYCQQPRSAHAE